MKIKFMLSGCIIILLLSYAIVAAEGLYLSGNIGASVLSDADLEETFEGITETAVLEFDTGLNFGVAFGHDFGSGRVELAVDYKPHKLDRFNDVTVTGVGSLGDFEARGKIHALSVMGNGFYDIQLNSPVTPYIGGGAGFTHIRFDESDITANDTVFAYQVGAGIGYHIDSESVLDIGYRYFAASDPEFDGVEAEYRSHNFVIGLRLYIE